MAKKLGTIFVELGIDSSEFTKGEAKILQQAQSTSLKMEQNWRTLGSHSDQIFDAMKANVTNAYNAIANNTKNSLAEITRAEEAKNAKITQFNEQQFGKQTSFIDSLKQNWVAASAAIVAAWMLVNKAVEYMDVGAKALQVESSFKIMAEAAGVNSQSMIDSMSKATKHTVDDSDLMQKAIKLMLAGYSPDQIVRFSQVVIAASQYMGTTVGEAYERLSDALATRMPKAMVQAGAVTKEQMKIVTEAMSGGATQAQLMELAIANLALKTLQLQGTQDEGTLSLQRFHAQTNETKESVGKGLIVVMRELYAVFQGFGVASLEVSSGIYKLIAARQSFAASVHFGEAEKEYRASAAAFKQMADDDAKAADSLRKKMIDNFTGTSKAEAKATAESIAGAKAKVNSQMKVLGAIKNNEEAAKKYAEFLIKLDADLLKLRITEEEKYVQMLEAGNKGIIEDEKKTNDFLKKLSDTLLKEKISDAEQEVEFIKSGNKGIIEDAERTKKKQEKYAHDVFDAQKRVGEDLAKLTNNEYEFKKDILNKEYAALKKLLGDSETLRKWYDLRERELLQQKILQSDDFFAGMAVAYEQDFLKQKKWGQSGADIWRSMFGRGGAIEGTLNTFFADIFQGKLKSAEDYFNSFKDAVLNAFAKMIAEMTAQWIAFDLLGLKAGGGMGATGLIPAIAGILGLTTEKTPAASAEGGGGGGVGGGLGTVSTASSLYKYGTAAYNYLAGATAASTAAATAAAATVPATTTAATAMGMTITEAGTAALVPTYTAGTTAGVAGAEAGAAAGGGAAAGASGAALAGGLGFAGFVAAMIGYGIYDWATYKRTPNNPFNTFKEPESGLTSNQLFAVTSSMPYKKHGDYDSWKAVVVDQMIGKDLWDSVVNSPVYTPEWAYNRWVAEYGRAPNIDDVQFGSAWTWYKQLPEVQAGISTTAAKIPQWLESYRYGASPDDIPMTNWYAGGGFINEPVVGRGTRSGQGYVFGENGPELVTPAGKMGGGSTTNIFRIYLDGEEIKGRIRVVADKVIVDRNRSGINSTTRVYQ